ncbi:MAG: DNA polymerase III subunit alpha [Desulfatiglandaceae bacterium]
MSTIDPFVHLHVHTEYSLLDGAIRIKQMLAKCKSLNMPAVAVTDHGNMFGAVQFYDLSSKAGIKPIIGAEVYVAPGDRRDRTQPTDGNPSAYHLVLLVMNETGYRNLSRLITLGHLEGFYYHPRVDLELLTRYNEGLIALTGCLKGMVPNLIDRGMFDAANKKALELQRIFDHDRLYLEVQANKLPRQQVVNQGLRQISSDLSIPLVATNDCHYLNREDAEVHDVLLCIQTGKNLDDKNRLKFTGTEFYFKTREEMLEALPDFEDALDNTRHIAERCDYHMEFGNYKYPAFNLPDNSSLEDELDEAARNGLTARIESREQQEGSIDAEEIEEYRRRLEYELGIIKSMGFAGYFLIVADFIDFARKAGIPVGPGRGSAAGSLVAYSLRITNIDPLKYGLLFERFLNPDRISMPDIDIDFCINGRDEVIKYVAKKYGRENVSQIITFGTMKARGAIRDVGRTLNIPLGEVDRIAKLVPEGPGVKLESAIENEPQLKQLERQEGPMGKLLKISRELEGLTRHASTHACGVVIADRPLVDYLPLFKGSRDEIVTQFTMDRVEQLGLIKFDFLGLKTLTVIKQALDLILQTTGKTIDIEKIPLDDEATFKLCSEGKTTGVFQLESSGMKELLRNLRPEVFEDMIALVALYRPGPLGSNMVKDFIDGKNGKGSIRYPLPQLAPVLKETYGVILYQEQVMKIAQIVADYSLAEADELRKAVGKKKPEVLAAHKRRFIDGALANQVPKETAEHLFSLIDKFGGYGFNKSHSAAYALIAYQTAYLKAHYPVEFMAALLTQDMGNQDKTIKNIAECRAMGIQILPPDINESQSDFAVVEGKIRFGLGAVKNVGLKAVDSIIEERGKNGLFKDLGDFCRRIEGAKVNRRVIEGLIECGALDFTGIYRSRLLAALDDVMKLCGGSRNSNQMSMFDMFDLQGGDGGNGLLSFPEIDEWDEREKLRKEKDALGFYITGHPLDKYKNEVERFATATIQDLPSRQDKSEVKIAGVIEKMKMKRTKKGDKMAVITIEDLSGSIEAIVFPELFQKSSPLLKSEDPLLFTGTAEVGEGAVKIILQDLATFEAVRQKNIKTVEIQLHETGTGQDLLEQLVDLVFQYPGECRLRFRIEYTAGGYVIISAGERFKIFPSDECLSTIESIVGRPVKCFDTNGNGFH